MSTVIRNNISKNNKYYISKHRFLELKHFCLQYYEWKKAANDILIMTSNRTVRSTNISDPTYKYCELRDLYLRSMKLIEDCAKESDIELYPYILKGVTEDRSYVYLSTVMGIPCSRDTYYNRYRKFFYILSSRKFHVFL